MADPPNRPASVLATPSAVSARPVCRLIVGSPVIVATPRTWPTFSAMSTRMTGRKIGRRLHETGSPKAGKWNSGSPTHGAALIAVKST